jgi:hypothetical protein
MPTEFDVWTRAVLPLATFILGAGSHSSRGGTGSDEMK